MKNLFLKIICAIFLIFATNQAVFSAPSVNFEKGFSPPDIVIDYYFQDANPVVVMPAFLDFAATNQVAFEAYSMQITTYNFIPCFGIAAKSIYLRKPDILYNKYKNPFANIFKVPKNARKT